VPAPERTYTFAPLEWEASAESFLARAGDAIARASRGVDLTGGADPDYAYYTALPKVPFTSFSHVALPDPHQGQPEAAFGRFREQDGRTIVPVGVSVNHMYVDGADLGDLYEGLVDSFARAF
jgi:chloramphenicol O-acetyltransferase